MNIYQSVDKNSFQFSLQPEDAMRCAELCGQFNQHLKQIEERMGVNIRSRGNTFVISGDQNKAQAAKKILSQLYKETGKHNELSPETVHLFLQESAINLLSSITTTDAAKERGLPITLRTLKKTVTPRGHNQQCYIKSILQYDINFGIGPAGTGKTYLAVACAVQALMEEKVQRILLVRPAVEAGEKSGFLPGDLSQKIDPYLRPLYDALYEMLGFDRVEKFIDKDIIEVAALAYMRGRTLNNSYIILDEAQNTTKEQMKMFLTRIGFGSTAVITGDITQVDLPKGTLSGLTNCIDVLKGVDGIGFTWFMAKDVIRHPLVQKIVQAYAQHELVRAQQ